MAVRRASGVVAPAVRVIGPVTELPSASSMAKVTSEPSVSGSVGVVMLREPYIAAGSVAPVPWPKRSEEHTSELQSLMRISYAVFCLKKKNTKTTHNEQYYTTL